MISESRKLIYSGRNNRDFGQLLNSLHPYFWHFSCEREKAKKIKLPIFFIKYDYKKYIHTYIYIYIYIFKKKLRNQSQRIINLFPSCYAFLKFPKTRKKINRTSSDLLDYCYLGIYSSFFFIKKIWRSPVNFFFVFLEISKMRNRMEINL